MTCPITGCTITAPHRHEVINLDEPMQISPESYGCSKCHKIWPIGGAHLCVTPPADPEPQPGDGPEYHADHQAWRERVCGDYPAPCNHDPAHTPIPPVRGQQ